MSTPEAALAALLHSLYCEPMGFGPDTHVGTTDDGGCKRRAATVLASGVRVTPDEGLRNAIAAVHLPHRQGNLHNYGWNDAVAACLKACDAALAAPRDAAPETFTGQMTWPCTCGHPKGDHYFGDRLGDDGRMHTWCQRHDGCTDFRPSEASPSAALDVRLTRARDLVANYLWNEDDSGDEDQLARAHDLMVEVLGPSSEESVGITLAAEYARLATEKPRHGE